MGIGVVSVVSVVGVQTVLAFPIIGHAVAVGVLRGRLAFEHGPRAALYLHIVLGVDDARGTTLARIGGLALADV